MDKDKELAKEKLKSLSFSGKIQHIWEYYKYRIIFFAFVIFALSYTIYTKVTEIDYAIDVMVFSEDTNVEKTEENMEELFSKWLCDSYKDGEEYSVNADVTMRPEMNKYTLESVLAVNTKITANLAAGQKVGFIFDEVIYKEFFIDGDYSYLEDKEYSGELGDNAKKLLGLNKNIKYYYVTAYTQNVEKGFKDAVDVYEKSKIIFKKLKELK